MYFEQQILAKDLNFANDRLVRNIYDDLVMNHARRIIKVDNSGCDELSEITAADFAFSLDK